MLESFHSSGMQKKKKKKTEQNKTVSLLSLGIW